MMLKVYLRILAQIELTLNQFIGLKIRLLKTIHGFSQFLFKNRDLTNLALVWNCDF